MRVSFLFFFFFALLLSIFLAFCPFPLVSFYPPSSQIFMSFVCVSCLCLFTLLAFNEQKFFWNKKQKICLTRPQSPLSFCCGGLLVLFFCLVVLLCVYRTSNSFFFLPPAFPKAVFTAFSLREEPFCESAPGICRVWGPPQWPCSRRGGVQFHRARTRMCGT